MTLRLERNAPVPRLLMLSAFTFGPDFHVELDRAVFVAAGERLDYDGEVVVTAPSGEQRRYAASRSHWICRRG
ncbi:hypothetical protein ACIRBX_00720 [Kitasatospora sp. NPDC096147]|uniref:hypothetical protein n=1 Tax=Kitasatospora sp. NPDC096147 TaxID=3364093 RepID=UPI003817BDBB